MHSAQIKLSKVGAKKLLEQSQLFINYQTEWLSAFAPAPLHQVGWVFSQVDEQFYTGLSGMMLAFAAAGTLLNIQEFTASAIALYRQIERMLIQNKFSLTNLGHAGFGGSLIAIEVAEDLLGLEAELSKRAIQFLANNILTTPCQEYDFINGYSGLIAMLAKSKHCHQPEVDGIINHCIQKLQEHYVQNWWPSSGMPKPLCGLSHGYSGFAITMAALEKVFNQTPLISVSDLLAEEDAYFHQQKHTWPDRRFAKFHKKEAWCHGSGGIALARLALQQQGYSIDQTKLNQAIDNTASALIQGTGNHSLCHGDLGLFEVILQAKPQLLKQAWANKRLKAITKKPLTGLPGFLDSPGFMTGYSGIAYQLLRLIYPEQLPNILI